MRTLSALVLLCFCAPLGAAPPKLNIPVEIQAAGEYVSFVPDTDAVSIIYVGQSGLEPFPSDMLRDQRAFLLHVRGLPKGQYRFTAVGAGDKGEQTKAQFVVTVGQPTPGPGPPPDPGPTPGPGPSPPGPAPFPEKGLRVLVVFDSKKLTELPASQRVVIFSKAVRDYLLAKAGPGNYRFYPVDTDPKNDAKIWQDAFARKRDSVPWIVIGNGEGGEERPLPTTEEEMLALLKKYGG